MKKSLIFIYYFFTRYLPYFFVECFLRVRHRDGLVLNGCLDSRWGRTHIFNWGDDLNIHLAKELFNKNIIDYNASLLSHVLHQPNYMMIGSFFHAADKHTIVWGSGMISKDHLPQEKPYRIMAVRGKLTRQVLLENHIECPEVYGDPALLLPYIYCPSQTEKFKIGIIPHICDEQNPILKEYLSCHSNIKLISMRKYNDWHDVIDQINECQCILSSSLHGIIVADAYHIPNVWIEFSDGVIGKGFKFLDYFSSVDRLTDKAIFVHKCSDFDLAIDVAKHYQPITIDLAPLIQSCPFRLHISNDGKYT